MNWIAIESVWLVVGRLVRFHFAGLPALLEDQRKLEVLPSEEKQPIAKLCQTVELVSVFLPFHVSPIVRSAATALLLRRHGWRATLVLGARIFPVDGYAWVEVGGKLVNDPPVIQEIYRALERC